MVEKLPIKKVNLFVVFGSLKNLVRSRSICKKLTHLHSS